MWNILGIYKIKVQHMKTPPTKYNVLTSNYKFPLPFTKMNSTGYGHYIISCENPLFVRCRHGSPAPDSKYPMVTGYALNAICLLSEVLFKRQWYSVRGMQYVIFVNDFWTYVKGLLYLIPLSPNNRFWENGGGAIWMYSKKIPYTGDTNSLDLSG